MSVRRVSLTVTAGTLGIFKAVGSIKRACIDVNDPHQVYEYKNDIELFANSL